MGIGFSFTGKVQPIEEFIECAKEAAGKFGCRLGIGQNELQFDLYPGGGELHMSWEPEDGIPWTTMHVSQKGKPSKKKWIIEGDCQTTPIGAGLHKTAIELLDMLPIKELEVDDETGYYEDRDFEHMKQAHFYGWLNQLVMMCRQRPDACPIVAWDMGRYLPKQIEGTVITYMGRFSIPEMINMVEQQGISALADRFFIWDAPEKDARFFRNRALNVLWEHCYFAPSDRSDEDRAINEGILNDLERAAKMDPDLPLPRAVYREICTLAGRQPILPDGPELESSFSIGFRRDFVIHSLGELELTLPGSYQYEWEETENGGTNLWCDVSIESPIWRVNGFGSDAEITGFLPIFDGTNDPIEYEIPNGRAKWGWTQLEGKEEPVYQIQCQVITGSVTFLITVTYFKPEEKDDIAVLLGKLSAKPLEINKKQAFYPVDD